MPPPSPPAKKGRNGGAQIIEFPGKPTAETTPPAQEAPKGPPSGPRSSPAASERSSLYQFEDFSDLQAVMSGRSPRQSVGAYGTIQLYLEILANPKANGGYQAVLHRENQAYEFTQDKPDGPIGVKFYQETTGRSQGNELQLIPRFQLTYLPDGQLRHTSNFDAAGNPLDEKLIPQDRLRGAALGDHEATLDFLRRRQGQLGKGCAAFDRMEAPLQRLRPSHLDLAQRAEWFENFVVLEGKVYSIRTQNLGFGSVEPSATSQNSIAVFVDQGIKNVELFRFSKTGEFDYAGDGTPRQTPTPEQITLLDRLSSQLERAVENPREYQADLYRSLDRVEKKLKLHSKLSRPAVTSNPFQANPAWKNIGPYREPIETITNGRDLWKIIRPIFPQTWRWENPENPEEVRRLRPQGRIRAAMARELLRWAGSAFWNGTINHVTNLKPQAGKLKLHLLPDGSADLEIYRNFTRHYPDGTLREERGIYNILRRNADKTFIDLNRAIKEIALTQPDILELPRVEQLKLASRNLGLNSDLPRSLHIETIPEIPIQHLQTNGRAPQNASEAMEALQQLPQLHGLKAQYHSEIDQDLLGGAAKLAQGQRVELGRENRFELSFPGSQPPTHLEVHEQDHTTGKRVVVHLWQGDNISTAVFDEGNFNEHESVRLNMAVVNRARQGTLKPKLLSRIGKGIVQARSYVQLHGLPYVLGYMASYPAVRAYEELFWTPEQRKLIGTPPPEFTLNNLAYEAGAALAIMGFSGGMAMTVDGTFNYGGGVINTVVDKFQKGLTWRQTYRYHSPRLMNPPPARFRPIPKPALSLANIRHSPSPWSMMGRSLKWSAPYIRSVMQRGVPLFSGLLAASAYHQFGKSWNLADVKNMDLNRLFHTFEKVGVVSLLSTTAWGLAGRRTELALARQVAGQPIRGLGGFLLRNKWLARAPAGMAGARLALTFRSSLLTVPLEMAALGCWDAYERKQDLIAQEKVYRADLSRSMDRYNRILSRLEYGEALSPQRIQAAESEVHEAHQRYQAYLQLMEKTEGDKTFVPVAMKNDFADTYEAIDKNYWLAMGGLAFSTAESSAVAVWEQQNRLQQLRNGEDRLQKRLVDLYRSYGLPVSESEPEEDLKVFMARTAEILKKGPEALEKALTGRQAPQSPVALDDPRARALIDHLKWKIEKDPEFLKQPPSQQARYILRTFSGYRTQASDGTLRPWNEAEAAAFIHSVVVENQRRLAQLEEPLFPMPKNFELAPEQMEKLAKEEAKIIAEETRSNLHLKEINSNLAKNGGALKEQMDEYFTRANRKRDVALIQYMPADLAVPSMGNSGNKML